MDYTFPNYYQKFSCIGKHCEDTCCAGWSIVIDEKSLQEYVRQPGIFGNRLHNSIDWKEKTFLQRQHRCAFLNEQNLCDIYLEAGKKKLCKTCRTYPRHIEEYEDLREISLSLSCPEAARIILGNPGSVRFLTKSREHESEEYEYFDYLLFTKLLDARTLMIEIAQRRDVNIHVRMAMILALAHDMQRRILQNQLFAVDELLERYGRPQAFEQFEKKLTHKLTKPAREEKEYFFILYQLEVLRKDWSEYLERTEEYIGIERGISVDDVVLEQLLVYFLFVYFAGAVYDERPYEKVKLAVYCTRMIEMLLRAQDVESDFEVVVDIAHRFAREIEHSDLNLQTLEQEFMENPIFNLEPMISWIMGRK
jgi:lysine-N-methylase